MRIQSSEAVGGNSSFPFLSHVVFCKRCQVGGNDSGMSLCGGLSSSVDFLGFLKGSKVIYLYQSPDTLVYSVSVVIAEYIFSTQLSPRGGESITYTDSSLSAWSLYICASIIFFWKMFLLLISPLPQLLESAFISKPSLITVPVPITLAPRKKKKMLKLTNM